METQGEDPTLSTPVIPIHSTKESKRCNIPSSLIFPRLDDGMVLNARLQQAPRCNKASDNKADRSIQEARFLIGFCLALAALLPIYVPVNRSELQSGLCDGAWETHLLSTMAESRPIIDRSSQT